MRKSAVRSNRLIHQALGHAGARRASDSNIMIDGHVVKLDGHDPTTCPGCRLGNTGKALVRDKKSSSSAAGDASRGFAHFGQQIDTDLCTGFAPSFPHHFRSMIDYCDRYGHEMFVYFLRGNPPDAGEVCSASNTFVGNDS